MATDVENLKSRRSTIYTELAALSSAKAGGKANTAGGGGTHVDHVGYKDGLYRELKELNTLIAAAEDTFEVISEACA
jgi:hypothetical protein